MHAKTLLVVLMLIPFIAWLPPGLADHCTQAAPYLVEDVDDAVDDPRDSDPRLRLIWDGAAWGFDTTAVDPDGDPLGYAYRTSDSDWVSMPDGNLSWLFDLGLVPGETLRLGFWIRAMDDPTARCTDALPASVTTSRSVEVHHAPTVTQETLSAGESCHDGEVLPSWNRSDIIAGGCVLLGRVSGDTMPAGVVDTVVLAIDGTPLRSAPRADPTSFDHVTTDVPDGPHTLGLCARASTDPAGRLQCGTSYDHLDIDCTNPPPELAGVVADGLLGGPYGWLDLPYVLKAFAYDLDDDPVSVSWAFPDGTQVEGTQATRTFPTLGIHTAAITLQDDVSERCPYLFDQTITETRIVFQTVADPVTRITRPGPGFTCDLNEVFPSFSEDAIAVSCEIEAEVELGVLPPEAVERGTVYLNGSFYAKADGASGLRTYYNTADRAEGIYGLEACWTMQRDKHARSFCSGEWSFRSIDCSNRAPTVGTVFGEGLDDGFTGWVGRDYVFDASSSFDLDRDPMIVQWTWSDGLVQTGSVVTRSFPSPGAYEVTLSLSDDPSERCPLMPSYATTSVGPTFLAVPEWEPVLDQPRSGRSCYGGLWTMTWTSEDWMSGRCAVQASVSGVDDAIKGLVQGELRVDGRAFHRGSSVVLSTVYDSTSFTTAGHVMDACFRAEGDIHDVHHCTPEHPYLNIGT
ncbi:MAG: PKD domain-containing protein [Euryarchaeota archaeon]|nr:PKD domain-containing protein [Euryarchaeota archaeon]